MSGLTLSASNPRAEGLEVQVFGIVKLKRHCLPLTVPA